MRTFSRSRRLLAATFAAAAFVPTASAQADAPQEQCDVRLERLVAQFYDMAERRGYDEASDWWAARWQAYHTSCVMH
jgi:hypothetical protein